MFNFLSDMPSHIKTPRLNGLPEEIRSAIIGGRRQRGWTQAEFGRRVGLPQVHISGIETGKIVPRFDTLLDLVRVLDRDLVMVPRALVPVVQALIRDHQGPQEDEGGERPLYAIAENEKDREA